MARIYILAADQIEFDQYMSREVGRYFRRRAGDDKSKPLSIRVVTPGDLYGCGYQFYCEILPGFLARQDPAAQRIRDLCHQFEAILLNI